MYGAYFIEEGVQAVCLSLGQDVEKELELQISMRQEMELAMKMLEKDVCEKQDALVSLRQQLDDLRALKHELAFKLQVNERQGIRSWLWELLVLPIARLFCRLTSQTRRESCHLRKPAAHKRILRLSYTFLLLFMKIMATFHIVKGNQIVFLFSFFKHPLLASFMST
jgi:hypothetical protein